MWSSKTHLSFRSSPVSICTDTAELSACQKVQTGRQTDRQVAFQLHMWHALPKPATYAYHVKEQFSPSMDSSINKLTNCQYTIAKCWQVCFWWGLFLRSVRHPRVLGCPLNATGWLVQATTLLEITIRLVDDTSHWFSYVLWQFEWNGASLWAISPWKMQSSAVTRHFVATHHPHPPSLYKCLWCW